MSQFQFRLFVTGGNPTHERVAHGLRCAIERECPQQCELQVIDVCRRPDIAEAEGILATPTLIKTAPQPVQRVVGEFVACSRTLARLGLHPDPEPPPPSANSCAPP